MSVDIKTIKPGATFSTTAPSHPSKADAVSDNAADPGTLRTYAPNPVVWTSNIKPQKLFPFDASYSYFTGACALPEPDQGDRDLTRTTSTTINPAAAVHRRPGRLPAAERDGLPAGAEPARPRGLGQQRADELRRLDDASSSSS